MRFEVFVVFMVFFIWDVKEVFLLQKVEEYQRFIDLQLQAVNVN